MRGLLAGSRQAKNTLLELTTSFRWAKLLKAHSRPLHGWALTWMGRPFHCNGHKSGLLVFFLPKYGAKKKFTYAMAVLEQNTSSREKDSSKVRNREISFFFRVSLMAAT